MRAEPGSVDISQVLSVCRSGESLDSALLKELLGHFVTQNRRRMAAASEAVHGGDRPALREIAHAVTGSAALMGATRLRELASTIEHQAVPGDINLLRAAVHALNREFAAVIAVLRERHPDVLTD